MLFSTFFMPFKYDFLFRLLFLLIPILFCILWCVVFFFFLSFFFFVLIFSLFDVCPYLYWDSWGVVLHPGGCEGGRGGRVGGVSIQGPGDRRGAVPSQWLGPGVVMLWSMVVKFVELGKIGTGVRMVPGARGKASTRCSWAGPTDYPASYLLQGHDMLLCRTVRCPHCPSL